MTAERQTLSGSVAGQILDTIDDMHLQPGDLLPSEANLVTTLGVSRVVVREAIKVLEGQGVIESRSGKGTVVRPADGEVLKSYFNHVLRSSPDGIIELMEVRWGIETFGTRLAAQRRSAAEAREISRITRDMRGALQEPQAFADLDVAFHIAIAHAARNSLLSSMMISIREAMRGAVLAGLQRRQSLPEMEHVQQLHEDVADAIAAVDPDRAYLAMSRHFTEAVGALVE